jgi:hypothetical protein
VDRTEFGSELRRMASTNGVMLSKEDRITDTVFSRESGKNPFFINIFSGTRRQGLLLVTAAATYVMTLKLLSVKLEWVVEHSELRGVRHRRGTIQDFVVDEVELDRSQGTNRFEFGFNTVRYGDAKAQIAAKNCNVAVREIETAWRRQRAEQPQPVSATSAEPQKRLSVRPEIAERIRRRWLFVNDVRHLGSAEMVGRPFGPGQQLETAIYAATQRFPSVDEVRESSGAFAHAMLIGMFEKERYTPDQLRSVMGADEAGFQRSKLSPAEFGEIADLAGAVFGFLQEFPDQEGPMFDLWNTRDDVSYELLAWQVVAEHRLAAAGLTAALPIEPPL